MLTEGARTRLLIVLLRLAGTITASAFLAIILPADWMSSTHRWIGLGEFPRAPVVDYLARSIAALYGFHGVLLLIVSRDPASHRGIVQYIAFMNICFGLIVFAIDLHAGLPMFWTVGEGPPVVAFGIIVALLSRGDRRASARPSCSRSR